MSKILMDTTQTTKIEIQGSAKENLEYLLKRINSLEDQDKKIAQNQKEEKKESALLKKKVELQQQKIKELALKNNLYNNRLQLIEQELKSKAGNKNSTKDEVTKLF